MKKVSRRTVLAALLPGTTLMVVASPGTKQSEHCKGQWRKLTSNDVLGPGDMWSSHDPNTPERQGEDNYNLQMQAVSFRSHGKLPGHNCNNGWHWRPVGIVPC